MSQCSHPTVGSDDVTHYCIKERGHSLPHEYYSPPAPNPEDPRIERLRELLDEWGKPPGVMLKKFMAEVRAIVSPDGES